MYCLNKLFDHICKTSILNLNKKIDKLISFLFTEGVVIILLCFSFLVFVVLFFGVVFLTTNLFLID